MFGINKKIKKSRHAKDVSEIHYEADKILAFKEDSELLTMRKETFKRLLDQLNTAHKTGSNEYLKQSKSLIVNIPNTLEAGAAEIYLMRINQLLQSFIDGETLDETSKAKLEQETTVFENDLKLNRLYNQKIEEAQKLDVLLKNLPSKQDPGYQKVADRYSDIKQQLKMKSKYIRELKNSKEAGRYVSEQYETQSIIKQSEQFMNMDFEEARQISQETDIIEQERQRSVQGFQELIQKNTDNASMEENLANDELTEDLENNVIDQVYSPDEATMLENMDGVDNQKVESALKNLEAKVNAINEGLIHVQSDLKQTFETKLEEIMRVYVQKQTFAHGDIVELIDTFLEKFSEPQFTAAATKMRSQIETWFRFEHGDDFSSPQMQKTQIYERFNKYFNQNDAKKLKTIWRRLNDYVHNDTVTLHQHYGDNKNNQKEDLKEFAQFLKQKGIHTDYPPNRLVKLMDKENQWLENTVKELSLQGKKFKPAALFKQIQRVMKEQNKRAEYLKQNGVTPPEPSFKNADEMRTYYERFMRTNRKATE